MLQGCRTAKFSKQKTKQYPTNSSKIGRIPPTYPINLTQQISCILQPPLPERAYPKLANEQPAYAQVLCRSDVARAHSASQTS